MEVARVSILKNHSKSILKHDFQNLEIELLVQFFQDFDTIQKTVDMTLYLVRLPKG